MYRMYAGMLIAKRLRYVNTGVFFCAYYHKTGICAAAGLRKPWIGGSMSKKIYLKINRNNEVSDTLVRVSDVADVYCQDVAAASKAKTLVIGRIEADGRARVSMSSLRIIEAITSEIPGADVDNIGEEDFIVDYIDEKNKGTLFGLGSKAVNAIKVLLICIITFMGSAYAIMAYDNDVGTKEIFAKAYEMILGGQNDGTRIMEIMFSIGLTLGIAVFYNHFGGKSFSNDPTPIEVEMNTYEQDIDYALIERGSRSGKELT